MNALMVLRVALKALRVNKLRSSLTMLGIIIGVAAVIAMLAIGGGAQERVREQIEEPRLEPDADLPGFDDGERRAPAAPARRRR